MNPSPATAAKASPATSQHAQPKSDIEISQAAKKRPILDIAREKLGIGPENLEPYGHYKASVRSTRRRPAKARRRRRWA
jgi:formate--tetrahydrofolate ligase